MVLKLSKSLVEFIKNQKGHRFSLVVHGNCMRPLVENDEQIVIEVTDTVVRGDLVVFYREKKHITLQVKQVVDVFQSEEGTKLKVQSLKNPVPRIISIEQTIGKVIEE